MQIKVHCLRKKPTVLALCLLLLSCCLSAFNFIKQPSSQKKYVSIQKKAQEGAIQVDIQNKGGHTGNCIQLKVVNQTSKAQHILLEPGRRLTSADSTIQDIFIVKKRKLKLAASGKETIQGYGFCCQSHKGGPYPEASYELGYMAPPKWVNLAKFLDTNSFPKGSVQDAVWALSNDHAIGSVHHEDLETIRPLREKVADLKGVELPWYSKTYEEDTASLFSHEPKRVKGEFSYTFKNNTIATLQVKRQNGQVMKILTEETPMQPVEVTFNINLLVAGWPKGTYEINLYGNHSQLKRQKTFWLE